MPWYGDLADIPAGFLYCDGTNGTPDLRGRTLVGTGLWNDAYGSTIYSLGSFGGERVHKLTIEEMPAHDHTTSLTINSGDGYVARGLYAGGRNDGSVNRVSNLSGGDRPHNNMQPYMPVHWIIKL
ncbi:phage baseplate protein [Sporomusa sphaeroides]|uniref:Baseplate structural protein Gp10 C-terminal domain-containing protein n=1 Tax=Sporomusa sphaeroides DSM 2875 TaxID=1337886 RepID=A0A1U7M9Y7_9FIRM|nr:hypothetical protein [Sporomusa sphaeroides]OLS54370.1 hypothetical protein SPSPH_46160 [Sporomusa sphaeroides DSM 2875]CVK21666.1 hypothetical protein SSPH_04361 [Sporomusa sphaeroides DSM 2875]